MSDFTGKKANALNKLGDELSAQHAKDEEKEGKRGARNNSRKDRKRHRK